MTDSKLPTPVKRKPPAAGKGRVKGTPNRITRDMRQAIAEVVAGHAEHVYEWISQIKDPARKVDAFSKLLGFVLPRLERIEATLTTKRSIHDFSADELRIIAGLVPPDNDHNLAGKRLHAETDRLGIELETDTVTQVHAVIDAEPVQGTAGNDITAKNNHAAVSTHHPEQKPTQNKAG